MATAYIIKTADGQMQINYGDGSVQTGTEDQLRATLAKNLPDYNIEIFNSKKTAAENLATHQAKYEKPGDFGAAQQASYQASSSSPSISSSSAAASSGSSKAPLTAEEQLIRDLGISDSGANTSEGWLGDLKTAAYNAIKSGQTIDPSYWGVTGGKRNYGLQVGDTNLSLGRLVQYDDEGPRIQAVMDTIAKYNANKAAEAIIEEAKKPNLPKPSVNVPSAGTGSSSTSGGVSSSTAGGGFTSTQPSTEVINIGPGEVAPIDPNKPQTVVQQVGPVNYGTPQTIATEPTEGVDTGTTSAPLQTAGLSAVPSQITYKTHYAGTQGAVPQTLVTTAPGVGTTYDASKAGYQTVTYANALGQRIPITEFNGMPTTYVPPGFMRLSELQAQQQALTSQAPEGTAAAKGGLMRSGYAEGGQSTDRMLEAKYRIATMNGYNGPKTNSALDAFANASPAMTAKFRAIGVAVAKGGYIRGFAPGGDIGTATTSIEDFNAMQQGLISQTMQPIQAPVAGIQPTAGEFIPVDAGMTTPGAPFAESATVGTVQQAEMPTASDASTYTATTAAPQVQAETDALQAATGTVSDQAQVTAAQQGTSAVSDLKAEQGTAIMMDNPVQREIQDGELISGAANAEKAAEFTEQIEAATASPSSKATVAGQLEGLMAQFEGGNTPPWAAGSMRTAMATLSARGLGASSLAGQAVIQAAMEAALPIAQADANTIAQFEAQNLSNRQQRAMLAAQQRAQFLGQEFDQAFQARVANSARIGDIANMNFTAEQNIALENSRAANTMNLNNLSNRQALVMAEAAALANLDMANLNNRQQAAVQNAQNFLQMDMANLSNEQQTAMFKAQQNIQALFTDQAAENAAAQFNASSENQTNQFFANLASQTSQFNATQQNAMDQFNVNSVNAMRKFNSEIQQQRDLFNAQNGLVIAQANAQWRQNIATLNQAAQNQSNLDFAKTINALTSTNLDQIWQRERDIMSFAFTAQQSALDRSLNLLLGDKKIAEIETQLSVQKDAASTELAFRFLFGSDPAIFGGIFNNNKG